MHQGNLKNHACSHFHAEMPSVTTSSVVEDQYLSDMEPGHFFLTRLTSDPVPCLRESSKEYRIWP
jgi:hypothetical protein